MNSSGNYFPMLLVAGSSHSYLAGRGDFQELDAVSLLTPHVKTASRPAALENMPDAFSRAYRIAWSGRPGTGFVDLPADHLQMLSSSSGAYALTPPLPPPLPTAEVTDIASIADVIKAAKAPLVLIGKGCAYARAEGTIRQLIDRTQLPFLPSPMGVGVMPSSHPCNTSSARSTALRHADVVLVLGARLNWIFHFGAAPKWNKSARFLQVDIDPSVIGHNSGDTELGVVADVKCFAKDLLSHLSSWQYSTSTPFRTLLQDEKANNETKLIHLAQQDTQPLQFARAYHTIRSTLDSLSPPSEGGICYIAEGARTMDTSRSWFHPEHPRLRLDAGSHGTMGVGMGYAIAAWETYNGLHTEASSGEAGRKKIVCLVGDSAFGFSGMEVETMARYGMDVLIFVMNNGGVYHGHADSRAESERQREFTKRGKAAEGLRSWSLGYEVGYDKLAEAVGGKGFVVRTSEELAKATKAGFEAGVRMPMHLAVIDADLPHRSLSSSMCSLRAGRAQSQCSASRCPNPRSLEQPSCDSGDPHTCM